MTTRPAPWMPTTAPTTSRVSRRRRGPTLAATALLAGLVASCASGGEVRDPGASATRGATASVTATPPPGGIPRPDCIPASATFANVPSGTDLVTPVALLGTPGDRGVVLGSQSNGGICQMVPFASEVAERGYRVAVIEWRGDRTDSMAAAVRTMTADGARRVVVGGFSEGAVIGLGGAATFGPTVVGVVAVSGGPSREDGYPSIASVSGFPGPLLLARARDDSVFPADTEKRIAAAHAGKETVLVLDGYEHALALLRGEHGPELRRAIYAFLAEVLPAG